MVVDVFFWWLGKGLKYGFKGLDQFCLGAYVAKFCHEIGIKLVEGHIGLLPSFAAEFVKLFNNG
jgi:hypothetical protein